jgi:hypothetical protein
MNKSIAIMLCKRIFVVMARKQLTPARRQPRLRLDQVLMMCKRSVSLLLCLSGLLGVGCMNISDQKFKDNEYDQGDKPAACFARMISAALSLALACSEPDI